MVHTGNGGGGFCGNLAKVAQAGGEVSEGLFIEQLAVDAVDDVGDLRGDGLEFVHEISCRAGGTNEVERFLAGNDRTIFEWERDRAGDDTDADEFVAEKAFGLNEELGIGADLVLGLDFGVESDDAGVGVEVDRTDFADWHAGHEDNGVLLEAIDVFCREMQQVDFSEGVGALGEVDDQRGRHNQRDDHEQADFPFCFCFHD